MGYRSQSIHCEYPLRLSGFLMPKKAAVFSFLSFVFIFVVISYSTKFSPMHERYPFTQLHGLEQCADSTIKRWQHRSLIGISCITLHQVNIHIRNVFKNIQKSFEKVQLSFYIRLFAYINNQLLGLYYMPSAPCSSKHSIMPAIHSENQRF